MAPVEEQRRVRAIVSVGDQVLGAAPVFTVDSPWWPDVELVTQRLDAMLGVPTAVLRLVDVAGGQPPRGGQVTYHVEASAAPVMPVTLDDVDPGVLRPEPLRAAWAERGGPAAILAWADAELARRGRPRTGPPVQVKTWNLSCVHRLPTARGPVWSKVVGAFQRCESVPVGAVAGVDPTLVPVVVAADASSNRTLLDHVPGVDLWQAGEHTVRTTVTRWVAAQAMLAAVPVAVPDLRLETLADRVAPVLDRVADQLAFAERGAVATLLVGLPRRIAAIREAGVPDTLVHGDFHPGNWRAVDGGPARVVDWADSYLGHPAADLLRLRRYLPDERRAAADSAWTEAWRTAVPGSDPATVIPLFAPLVHLHGAYVYQRFLDHIEPAEQPYHRDDPAAELRAALSAGR